MIVDELDTVYADTGSGVPILFLHGWGTGASSFESLMGQLPKGRCISLALPGFGGSELPHTPWSVRDYAEFVHDFLEKLEVQPAVIIAHSFGGRIAIKGVGQKLLTPEKLVLIAAAGMARRPSRILVSAIARTAKAVTALPPFSLVREPLKRMAGSRDYINAGPMKDTFVKVIGENLESDAREVKIPTLLIWGEEDKETPLTEAQLLHRSIQSSDLEIIPEAGHFVFQEKPAEVAELIQKFI